MGEGTERPKARKAKPMWKRAVPATKKAPAKRATKRSSKRAVPATKKAPAKRATPPARKARLATKSVAAVKPQTRRSRTKPQKNAIQTTAVTFAQFASDDEVVNFSALKYRLAEMLSRADIHERDFKAVSVEYRAVMVELREARERAAAEELGKGGGPGSIGERTRDGDI